MARSKSVREGSTQPEMSGGGNPSALPGGPEVSEQAPATSPLSPAAAVATSKSPEYDGAPKPHYGPRPDVGFADEVDEQEKQEKNIKRKRDAINEAVGSDIHWIEYNHHGWILKSGEQFWVTRFYQHQNVVIDFPRDDYAMKSCPEKKQVCNSLGVVYIAIDGAKGLTIDEMRREIQTQRAAISGQLNAKGES